MKTRQFVLVSLVFTSCAASSQLNYIKTEVYKSSWNPVQVLKKIWLGKDCSRLCQLTYNCTAYHHDRCFRICELGTKNGLTSAVQPWNDTVTVFIQPDYLKLLLTGNAGAVEKSVEVINFKSNNSVCTRLPDYPYFLRGTYGGLVDKITPMICGGADELTNQCYKLESGAWQSAPSLQQARYHFAGMPFSPFHNSSHKSFVLGGQANVLSTEVLTDSGWETTSTVLPIWMFVTCMVAINEDTYFVHGGQQASTKYSPQTYFFAVSTNSWTRGPDLTIGRYGEGCGTLPMNEKSSQISLVLAGGFYGSLTNLVEILDAGSQSWRIGPRLPQPCRGSPLVQHPNGGLIYIIANSIYYLANAGPAAEWQLLPQKVTVSRIWFSAFFVPDDVTECT